MLKSESYYKRQEIMDTLEMPTMSQISSTIGGPLSTVFFKQCPQALGEDIGLTPPLEGPGELLWNSPSDLLIGKVVLKPPLTDKHVKALTHEGILSLGLDVEKKFVLEMDNQKQKALKEQERILLAEAERNLQQAVITAKREEQALYEKRLASLNEEFNKYLEEQLAAVEDKLVSEYQSMFEEEREKLEAQWEERLEEATEETVTRLTKKFLEDLMVKERELNEIFERTLKQQEIEAAVTLEEEQKKCRSTLRSLQHNLECKNIANMMYVLCVERRKCESERDTIKTDYENKIAYLEKLLKTNKEGYEKLTKEKEELETRLDIRESLLCEVLKQFQKFINFALRSHPTQAEFLLDIEKMLTYELTRALVAADPKCPKYIRHDVMPWKSDAGSSSSKRSTLEAYYHHDCLNLASRPPSSGSSISESDLLPAMFYKDGMYIREDFRNMLSQGLTLTPDSLLWNKNVEHLLQIFKKVSRPSVVRDSIEREFPTPERSRSQQSAHSSVHFGNKEAACRAAQRKMRSIMSNTIYEEEKVVDKVQYATEDSLGLLCVKDSLTKHRESFSIKGSMMKPKEPQPDVISLSRGSTRTKEDDWSRVSPIRPPSIKEEEQEIMVLEEESVIKQVQSNESKLGLTRDSIVLTRLSMKQNQIIPIETVQEPIQKLPEEAVEQEVANAHAVRRNSRLSLARDSIIVRKLSLGFDAGLSLLQNNAQCQTPVVTVNDQMIQLGPTSVSHDEVVSAKVDIPEQHQASSYLDFFLNSPETSTKEKSKSKITMHQDSLELIRERVHGSKSADGQRSKDFVVKPDHQNDRTSVVTFSPLPKVYETESYNFSDSPWMIYNRVPPEKKQRVIPVKCDEKGTFTSARVMGDQSGNEHVQNSNEFASTRINSMLDILKQSPDLIKMFTGCTN